MPQKRPRSEDRIDLSSEQTPEQWAEARAVRALVRDMVFSGEMEPPRGFHSSSEEDDAQCEQAAMGKGKGQEDAQGKGEGKGQEDAQGKGEGKGKEDAESKGGKKGKGAGKWVWIPAGGVPDGGQGRAEG